MWLGLEPYWPDVPRHCVPHINSWEPCYLVTVPDGPQPYILNFLRLEEKGAQIHICVCEARTSHSQRIWTEVWSPPPGFDPQTVQPIISRYTELPGPLHNGLSESPIKWGCLLRALTSKKASDSHGVCPVKRQISNLGTQINSWFCCWVLPRPCQLTQCWVTNCLILLTSCLGTHKAGSGPPNLRAGPPYVSSSASTLLLTAACPGTQYSPTACRVEMVKGRERSNGTSPAPCSTMCLYVVTLSTYCACFYCIMK
jgi:hypothetical protein